MWRRLGRWCAFESFVGDPTLYVLKYVRGEFIETLNKEFVRRNRTELRRCLIVCETTPRRNDRLACPQTAM